MLHGILELAIVSELLTHGVSGLRACLQCQLQLDNSSVRHHKVHTRSVSGAAAAALMAAAAA